MLEAREDHIVGRIVGPYRVLGRLGPEGEVPLFVTEHLHLDRQLALRLIAPEAGWASGGLDRFLTEARKLSRVRHRNVLQLVDLGETGDGHVYLAMELPRGQRLDRVIAAQGPIGGARARNIARQVGLALSAVTEVGLENRDIDARQIFLTTEGDRGDFVQIDFATVDMLAVELDRVSDGVQTLGRVLYHVLVGRPPFAAVGEAPIDPALARPELDIPSDLDALTTRALDPDPNRRWPDLDAMLRVLIGGSRRTSRFRPSVHDATAQLYADPGDEPGRSFGEPSLGAPSRRAVFAVGVVGVLAVIVAGAGWFARSGRLSFFTSDRSTGAAAVQARHAGGTLGVTGAGGPAGTQSTPGVPGAATALGSPNAVHGPLIVAPAITRHWNPAGAEVTVADVWVPPTATATGTAIATTTPAGAPGPAAGPGFHGPPGPSGFSVEQLPTAPVAAGARSTNPAAPARPGQPAPGAHGVAVAAAPPREGAAALLDPRRLTDGDVAGAAAAAARDERIKAAAGAERAGGGDEACAVTLGSRPWAEVWIDGHQAGFTPLVDYPIDCGSHEVMFKSAEAGLEKRVAIAVSPGQSFKKTVDLAAKDARPAAAQAVASAGAAAAPSACVVTLGSRPWSQVSIDGKPVGETPLVDLAIACGKHDVLFHSDDTDVDHHETIVVSRGRPLKKVVFLQSAPAE